MLVCIALYASQKDKFQLLQLWKAEQRLLSVISILQRTIGFMQCVCACMCTCVKQSQTTWAFQALCLSGVSSINTWKLQHWLDFIIIIMPWKYPYTVNLRSSRNSNVLGVHCFSALLVCVCVCACVLLAFFFLVALCEVKYLKKFHID